MAADGDDTLTGGLGNDVLEGGGGSDVAVFAGAMSAFTFSASSDGTLTVTDTNAGTSLGVDTVSGVEALQFTDGVLTVTTLSDGRVTLTGDGGSNEVTVVGETPVTLEGGYGDDILTGGSGSDDLEGGSGSDTVYGGDGSDFIDGDDGSDALFGEGGSDDIDGGLGNDTLDGGLGSDVLDGGEGDDTLLGQDGDDTLAGGTGDDTIIGGDGADVAVFAGNKENYVFSVAADGTLTVTDTNTSQGVDTVSGVETLRFDDGDLSVATAEDGHVTLTGSDADDVITIGEGISSGLRAEYYINTGGNGNFDAGTLYTTRTDANINFEQMWDGALPSNSPGGNSNFAVRWTGFIKGPADGQVNFYGRHDDGARLVIDGQSIFNNWSNQGPSNYNSNGSLTMEAGKLYPFTLEMFENGGGDVMRLDWSFPGQGITTVSNEYYFNDADTANAASVGLAIEGSGGVDTIIASNNADQISGGEGDDIVLGGGGSDVIYGNAGSDDLSGEDGEDTLIGGLGDDTLTGGSGSDTIEGGAGNDDLSGGAGSDTLVGGVGSDTIDGGDGADVAVFAGIRVITHLRLLRMD